MQHYRLPTCIGHRGVPELVAENSVAGLHLAADLGYRWCEIDAQASADGEAVIYHNFALEDGRELGSLSSALLTKYAIGSDLQTGAQLMLPTLSECLDAAVARGLGLVIEIKSRRSQATQNAAAVARALAGSASAEVLVSSFEPEALVQFGRLRPDLPLALNVDSLPLQAPDACANVHCDANCAESAQIMRMLDAGLGVYAWTVNDANVASRLLADGVHGFFTDTPRLLKLFP